MKQKITKVTEEQIEEARGIVRHVMNMQSLPNNIALGMRIIAKVISLGRQSENVELTDSGLDSALDSGLDSALASGLDSALASGLDSGLDSALASGLDSALDSGLDSGLHSGLRSGLRSGLDSGLHSGLRSGLRSGLHSGLDSGLHSGLRSGLHSGLALNAIRYAYVGIYWSRWLAQYLIAYAWGVPLDIEKLGLLYGYCRHAQLLGQVQDKDGKRHAVLLPNPSKVAWVETGLTDGLIKLPVYELHSDGTPAVESVIGKQYYFHNTQIPERMGTTHSKDWKVEWIGDETNAEVRMILIKELGIEKVVDKGRVVDSHVKYKKEWFTKSEYELVDMAELLQLDYAPYLKMKNQTTGVYHMEGVSPDCRTINDALSFRTGIRFNNKNVEIGSIQ